jgi:hypothetical protein
MELASVFVMPGRGSSRPPTVLLSVVALGLLAVYVLAVALVLGMLVGALIDGLLLGESFTTSLESAFDWLDAAGHELVSKAIDALLIACGGWMAARHAVHAPRLHAFLVAAATLAAERGMADEPLDSPIWQSAAVSAAFLLLATLTGGLATRWPDSSRSAFAALAARLRAKPVRR